MPLYGIEGDLFDFDGPDVYLCHQMNPDHPSLGKLARTMFEKYPCADPDQRPQVAHCDSDESREVVGTVNIVQDPVTQTHIVNMNARDALSFEACLQQFVINEPHIVKVYFPCGLGGEEWISKYLPLLIKWTDKYPDLYAATVVR